MSNWAGVSADGHDGYDGFDAAHHDGLTWLDVAIMVGRVKAVIAVMADR